ncbi:MAG: hypothetical protein LAO55_25655 [Acidobacteriia bacterium]|nr:hypothetical protein [Terriglobia bacterium]
MAFDPKALGQTEIQTINAQASTLMKRGIRLMSETHPGAVSEALKCFDEALELRRRLPIETASLLRFGLAACWLNRADALIRLGDAGGVSLALHAFDQGIDLLRGLALSEDVRFPRRLAIAHQNHGLALQSQGGASASKAIAAFTDSIAVLEGDHATLISDRQYLLAAVWMNLANARASEPSPESGPLARAAALRAITLIADLEVNDADAAEVGLKARHVLCKTLAARLSLPAASGETMPADVHEATDIVDDGLVIARQWEKQGVARFRDLACDLFRFGARVYARYQPQFLHEFVRDNIDPAQSSISYVESAEMFSAASEALDLLDRLRSSARSYRV